MGMVCGSRSAIDAELALRPPKTFEKFPSFSQNDFLSGGYPNRSSGIHCAQVWISAPDTYTPVFVGFLGAHRRFWFFSLSNPTVV